MGSESLACGVCGEAAAYRLLGPHGVTGGACHAHVKYLADTAHQHWAAAYDQARTNAGQSLHKIADAVLAAIDECKRYRDFKRPPLVVTEAI